MLLFLRPPSMAAMASLILSLLLITTMTEAHNITEILSKHPEFSTFNDLLTVTHLADKINNRQSITVCAVDNDAIKNLTISSVKNVLSLHILLDYFDNRKLHQLNNASAVAATMFKASGIASFVTITDLQGGKVSFSTKSNSTVNATLIKSISEIPYNISVVHISNLLPSSADALAPSSIGADLVSLMSENGCKVFADTLASIPAALDIFNDDVDGGLTIFCPNDAAFKNFIPKFKNLNANEKVSLLLFHGLPVYNSLKMFRSTDGLMNTLATDGPKKFELTVQNDGIAVIIDSKRSVARISGTVFDEQPLSIFTVDKVLLPKELFNSTEAPTPAPEPAVEVEPPKPNKEDEPIDGPSDSESEDDVADENGVVKGAGVVRVVSGLGLGVWLGWVWL